MLPLILFSSNDLIEEQSVLDSLLSLYAELLSRLAGHYASTPETNDDTWRDR